MTTEEQKKTNPEIGIDICTPLARSERYASQSSTIFAFHSKLEFIYSVEAQYKTQNIYILYVELKM
jgi:hypothetical protein